MFHFPGKNILVVLPFLKVKYCENTFVAFSAYQPQVWTELLCCGHVFSCLNAMLLSTSGFNWRQGKSNTATFHQELFERSHVTYHNTSKGAWIRDTRVPSMQLNSSTLKVFFLRFSLNWINMWHQQQQEIGLHDPVSSLYVLCTLHNIPIFNYCFCHFKRV